MTQTLKLSSNVLGSDVVTTQAIFEPLTITTLSNTVGSLTNGYVTTAWDWPDKSYYQGVDWAHLYPTNYEPPTQKEIFKYLKELKELTKPNKEVKKEEIMSDVKVKTVELFSGKSEDDQLLESYKVVDEAGDLTQTGWLVIGKLLLAEKKQAIVDKLKADRDSKKKTSVAEATPSA